MSSLILKWSTFLAILSAVVMAVLGIVSQFYPPVQTRIEWYISILLLVLADMLTYLYGRMELVENRTGLIVDKLGLQAIEIFRTRDELFSRLIDITKGSQMVSTQMFSDPPADIGGQMENYFKKIGRYIKRNPGMVFRRIATLGDTNKVRWLLELLIDMVGTENFSLAYIDVNHKTTPLLCIHLVQKNKELFTCVFHTVPATGNVYAFLIQNKEVGQVALDYYNGLWERSPKLMEGKQININLLRELVKRYGLESSEEYLKLREKLGKSIL